MISKSREYATKKPYLYGFEYARACFENTIDAVSNMKTMGPIMIRYSSIVLLHCYEESNLKIYMNMFQNLVFSKVNIFMVAPNSLIFRLNTQLSYQIIAISRQFLYIEIQLTNVSIFNGNLQLCSCQLWLLTANYKKFNQCYNVF